MSYGEKFLSASMVEIKILWFLVTLSLMIPPGESFGQSQSRPKFKGSN